MTLQERIERHALQEEYDSLNQTLWDQNSMLGDDEQFLIRNRMAEIDNILRPVAKETSA